MPNPSSVADLLCIGGDDCSVLALSTTNMVLSAKVAASCLICHLVVRTLLALCVPAVSGYVQKKTRGKDGKRVEVDSSTAKVDVLGSLLASIFALSFFTYTGFMACLATTAGGDIQTRLYQEDPAAVSLATVMIGYQTYSLAAGLTFDVLGGPDMIAHHSSVLVLCLTSYYPWAHYYIIFFIGAAEFSTVVLCFMDMFKHVPELGKAIPGADKFFRLSFAASFAVIRLGFWMCFSFWFLSDCYTLISTKKHHSSIVLVIYVVSNIGLCLLQMYWGFLIGMTAYNMAFPSSKALQKTD